MKKKVVNLLTLIHIKGSSQDVFDVDAQKREGMSELARKILKKKFKSVVSDYLYLVVCL